MEHFMVLHFPWTMVLVFTLMVFPVNRPLLGSETLESVSTTQENSLFEGWDELLKTHVNDRGLVNYKGIKKNPEKLEEFINLLAQLREIPNFSTEKQLAIYINAYNAFTLKLIVENYPKIGGIKEIPSSQRWDAKRWKLGENIISLTHLEHKILRKMGDPRIHFAIVCASIGCPKLQPFAFLPERIKQQLEQAVKSHFEDPQAVFIGDEKGTLWGTNRVVRISNIFSWFSEDFSQNGETVLGFVEKHANEKQKSYLKKFRNKISLKYQPWDWSLNDWHKNP